MAVEKIRDKIGKIYGEDVTPDEINCNDLKGFGLKGERYYKNLPYRTHGRALLVYNF